MAEAGPGSVQRQPEPRRACQECNRKKTRCDMRRPICGLCIRTGNPCSFPSRRKRPVARDAGIKEISRQLSDSVHRLIQALESAAPALDATKGYKNVDQSSQPLLSGTLKDLLAELKSSQGDSAASERQLEQNDDAIFASEDDEPGTEHEDDRTNSESRLTHVPNAATEVDVGVPVNVSTPSLEDGVTCSVAVDLVNLFFEKVQPWLPLFHRPRFNVRFEPHFLSDGDILQSESSDDALLLYSMFALSARFSNHPRFVGLPVFRRGHSFAEQARHIYAQTEPTHTPSLTYLQGCILLAHYFYTSGPTSQGWILIGICVRLAYDLGLSDIDDDDWAPASPVDLTAKEELRRAWWAVWELDTFASCVSRKPYAIDRMRIAVKLPVSDQAWFAGDEILSSELISTPGRSWRSLSGCRNQDERSWFLVANSFMATIHDRVQQRRDMTRDEKLTLENEVVCFKLALPPFLQLDPENLTFTDKTFAKCNWIIGTHLMLNTVSFLISGISSSESEAAGVTDASSTTFQPLRHRAIELSKIIGLWNPKYIAYSHPFLTCMML